MNGVNAYCWFLLALVIGVGLSQRLLHAQPPQPPREDHPWARFEAGAWKEVRVVAETLNEENQVGSSSVTDTSTRLVSVTSNSYELQIEMSVEVAGKKLKADPQNQTFQYLGLKEETESAIKNIGEATYAIDGKRIPCEVFEQESSSNGKKIATKIYYAKNFVPHVLKKESITTDASGETTLSETTESVVAFDMPHTVLDEILSTWHVRVLRKNAKGTAITLEVHSPTIPGGVVANSTKELDSTGRVIRRSTLEVVDYSLKADRPALRRRSQRKSRTRQ